MSDVKKIKLNNGMWMPTVGLGTWNMTESNAADTYEAVKDAIDAGYRHIDTALVYQNETAIGKAIREKIAEGVITRQDMFIVSKLWCTRHRPALVEPTVREQLESCGLEYFDLYLIHFPTSIQECDNIFPLPMDSTGNFYPSDVDHLDTYKAMETLVKKGLVKSIGLSNFNKRQVARILENCTIPPVMNQVECHPYLNQDKLLQFCNSKNIVLTAFSQFGSPASAFRKPEDPVSLQDPLIKSIGAKHGKSAGQVILRWLVQRGIVAIPKTVTKARLIENIATFDFHLSDAQITQINGLNRNHRISTMPFVSNHRDFPFADEF